MYTKCRWGGALSFQALTILFVGPQKCTCALRQWGVYYFSCAHTNITDMHWGALHAPCSTPHMKCTMHNIVWVQFFSRASAQLGGRKRLRYRGCWVHNRLEQDPMIMMRIVKILMQTKIMINQQTDKQCRDLGRAWYDNPSHFGLILWSQIPKCFRGTNKNTQLRHLPDTRQKHIYAKCAP